MREQDFKIGDITNFGIIEQITPYGNYVINGEIIGNFRDIQKIEINNLFEQ